MALTAEQLGRTNVTGNRLTVALKITFSGTYSTGGETLDLTQYVNNIETVHIENMDGYFLEYDRANGKVLVFESGADASANDEVANASGALANKVSFITVSGGRA